jgi:DNA-binding CsgD family transcriptional regulator
LPAVLFFLLKLENLILPLAERPAATDVLTPREFEILRMLLAERSTDDIADILHLSAKTVANTRYLIKAKLGVASDIELVLVALRQGILGESGGVEPDASRPSGCR